MKPALRPAIETYATSRAMLACFGHQLLDSSLPSLSALRYLSLITYTQAALILIGKQGFTLASRVPVTRGCQTAAEPNMLPWDQQTTGKQALGNRDFQQGFPLQLLPSATEPLIYGSLDAKGRNSLLQTSRWGRDALLREARSIRLKLLASDCETGANIRPVAGLLARACEAAEPGQLSLSLGSMERPSEIQNSNVLAGLLAPALQQGGWASVKELALSVGGP
jgi:hypothetical protein